MIVGVNFFETLLLSPISRITHFLYDVVDCVTTGSFQRIISPEAVQRSCSCRKSSGTRCIPLDRCANSSRLLSRSSGARPLPSGDIRSC